MNKFNAAEYSVVQMANGQIIGINWNEVFHA